MHGPAAVGGRWRVWFVLLAFACSFLGMTWAYREYTVAHSDAAKTRAAYEAALRDQAQQQEELLRLRERNQALEEALAQQRAVVNQAQTLTNTAQSQTVADQATQQELARQLRVLQQENGRLKQDLAFFQGTIPKGGIKAGVALRGFEAQRIAPTQVHWQALVVQPVKNAKAWTGQLNLTVSGTLAEQAWSQSPVDGPVGVNLVQFVRLQGVITVPAEAQLQSISARLTQGKRVIAVQTYKFK